jgi:hypothetical protein
MTNISTNLPDPAKGNLTVAYSKRSLRDKEASEYIGMSESWLRHNRISGQRFGRVAGPRFIKVGPFCSVFKGRFRCLARAISKAGSSCTRG